MTAKENDELLSGEALATPRMRAEKEIVGLLAPAAAALKRFLSADMASLTQNAQSAGYKAQAELAMRVIDGCLSMVGDGKTPAKSAARILAAVGGDAVTRELSRRYALREVQARSERKRIIDAVPAQHSDSAIYKEAVSSVHLDTDTQTMQPSATAADSGDSVHVSRETLADAASGGSATTSGDGSVGDT